MKTTSPCLIIALLFCPAPATARIRGPAVLVREGDDPARHDDIIALQPKPFLKRHRLEVLPLYAVTLNDTLLRHHAVGAEFNFFLTEILSVGVQGLYYFDDVLDQEFYTRYHFDRAPSLNRYRYTTTLNFAYVPIYGKFHLLNDRIVHFELLATAGCGISGTEIIPRDREYRAFSNPLNLTFPVGLGARLFLTRWLALQAVLRSYLMLDRFEPSKRGGDPDPEREVELARDNAKTRLVNNMIFSVGVSVFFPTSFRHRSRVQVR
jgi:outer membrane beta-barrel protein